MTNEQRLVVSALRAQGMGYGAIARKVGDFGKYSKNLFCRRNAQESQSRSDRVISTGEHRCLLLRSACGAERRPQGERSSALTSAGTEWWNAHLDKVDRRAIREGHLRRLR